MTPVKAIKATKRAKPSKDTAPAKTKPDEQSKKKRPASTYFTIAGIILGIIAIFGILYGVYHFTRKEALAEFSGEKITRDEFVKALRIEAAKYDPLIWKNAGQSMNIKREILNKLIEDKILLNEAKKLGVTASNEEIEADLASYKSGYTDATFKEMLKLKGTDYNEWTSQKSAKYLTQKLIKQEVIDKIEIDPNDVKKYYNEHSEEFSHPEQVRARHILASTWEEAKQIEKELENGANFAALAKNRSISPERWNGGDLGYFSMGTYPEVFDRVCFNIPVGEISQVVTSDYGYHIFKVIDKRGPAKESLEDAKKYITLELQREKSKDAFEKWFKPIYDSARVKINEDMLRKIEVAVHDEEAKIH